MTYTLTESSGGALPAGLTFDAATRTLSGTPTVVGVTDLYYEVTRSEDSANTGVNFGASVNSGPLVLPDPAD